MAFSQLSLCAFSLFVAGMATTLTRDMAKQLAPNGAQPFSIGVSVAPLSKVIDMMQKIMDDVLLEDATEEEVFENFACFCKSKNDRLVEHVKHHAKVIDLSASNVAVKTAETKALRADFTKRTGDNKDFHDKYDDTQRRWQQEKSTWSTNKATFENDQKLIEQALAALKSSKDAVSSAFLQVPAADKVKRVLDIADAMGVNTPARKALSASLLQGKKSREDPMDSYGYHGGSDDIIELVTNLDLEMKDLFAEQRAEHEKAVKSFRETVEALEESITTNQESMDDIELEEATKKKEIAQARKVLIENREDLDETNGVLSQITGACESRATEYDNRRAARTEELVALQTAMNCLSNAHTHASDAAKPKEVEMLLQNTPYSKVKLLPKPPADMKAAGAELTAHLRASAKEVADETGIKPLSFLQSIGTQNREAQLSAKDRRKKMALDIISSEGKRVKSLMLMSLASKMGSDPFAKVIQLITDLRWRLEEEEHEEVDKHVFCSQQLKEAEHERDIRFEKAKTFSMEVERLEAAIEKLQMSVKQHSDKAIEIGKNLVHIYTDISQLSKKQLQAMNIQKEARDEIKTAIRVLRTYYAQSAKDAARDAMSLVQDEPLEPLNDIMKDFRKERQEMRDENEHRAANEKLRDGERKRRMKNRIGNLEGNIPSSGRQGSLGDALALMETIVSDFDREIGNLEGDLDAEHKELVETNQVLTSQKMKAEELRDLDQQDLDYTKVKRKVKFEDMTTAMELCDSALKELEELRPTCVDTGMSYSERVKMRETEMTALENALCALGEKDPKYNCPAQLE
jgi:hypothetical protein